MNLCFCHDSIPASPARLPAPRSGLGPRPSLTHPRPRPTCPGINHPARSQPSLCHRRPSHPHPQPHPICFSLNHVPADVRDSLPQLAENKSQRKISEKPAHFAEAAPLLSSVSLWPNLRGIRLLRLSRCRGGYPDSEIADRREQTHQRVAQRRQNGHRHEHHAQRNQAVLHKACAAVALPEVFRQPQGHSRIFSSCAPRLPFWGSQNPRCVLPMMPHSAVPPPYRPSHLGNSRPTLWASHCGYCTPDEWVTRPLWPRPRTPLRRLRNSQRPRPNAGVDLCALFAHKRPDLHRNKGLAGPRFCGMILSTEEQSSTRRQQNAVIRNSEKRLRSVGQPGFRGNQKRVSGSSRRLGVPGSRRRIPPPPGNWHAGYGNEFRRSGRPDSRKPWATGVSGDGEWLVRLKWQETGGSCGCKLGGPAHVWQGKPCFGS